MRIKYTFLGISLLMLPSSGMAETISRVSFEVSTAILKQIGVEELEKVAKSELGTNSCLLLRGFISPNSKSSYHNLLGRARVLEVFRYLVGEGIAPERLRFRSLGVTDENGETGSGLQKNYIAIDSEAGSGDCHSNRINPARRNESKEAVSTGKLDVLSITFAHQSADPEEIDQNAFTDFFDEHEHDGSFRISIEGHSDMQGSDAYNRLLSKMRALKTYQLVVNAGFPGKFVSISFFGDTKPLAASHTVSAYKQNRRVSIRWQSVSTNDVPAEMSNNASPATTLNPYKPSGEDVAKEEIEGDAGPWELGGVAGYTSANASVSTSVKAAPLYGVYIRFHLEDSPRFVNSYELSYSRHSHRSQIDAVDGSLNIQGVRIGGIKTFDVPYLSPSIHLDFGAYKWSADATEESTSRTQVGSGSALGSSFRLGRIFSVGRNFKIEPQLQLEYLTNGPSGISRGLMVEFGWRL